MNNLKKKDFKYSLMVNVDVYKFWVNDLDNTKNIMTQLAHKEKWLY